MQSFKEFIDSQHKGMSKSKLWSSTKREIINYWRTIEPNQPIMPQPVPREKEGSTYGYDGIRITGSFEFIDSVLSRFKDFLYKESPHTKLNLIYRQIEGKDRDPNMNKYVFYINVGERGKGRRRPRLPAPKVV